MDRRDCSSKTFEGCENFLYMSRHESFLGFQYLPSMGYSKRIHLMNPMGEYGFNHDLGGSGNHIVSYGMYIVMVQYEVYSVMV